MESLFACFDNVISGTWQNKISHNILEMIRVAYYNKCMETKEKLIKLKESTGLNWRKFATYFGVPYRTMQDWYLGNRRMPEYMLRLMQYKLEMEKMISPDYDNKD